MSNSWDHLLNAKYIDAILKSSHMCPDIWQEHLDPAVCECLNNAFVLAINDLENKGLDNIWYDVWSTCSWAAEYSLLSLIVYDDCAYMLESEPGELAILAALGDNRAILLLPACKTLAAIKEKENA